MRGLLVYLQHAAAHKPLEAGLLWPPARLVTLQAPAHVTKSHAAGAAVQAATAAARVGKQACLYLRHALPQILKDAWNDASLQNTTAATAHNSSSTPWRCKLWHCCFRAAACSTACLCCVVTLLLSGQLVLTSGGRLPVPSAGSSPIMV